MRSFRPLAPECSIDGDIRRSGACGTFLFVGLSDGGFERRRYLLFSLDRFIYWNLEVQHVLAELLPFVSDVVKGHVFVVENSSSDSVVIMNIIVVKFSRLGFRRGDGLNLSLRILLRLYFEMERWHLFIPIGECAKRFNRICLTVMTHFRHVWFQPPEVMKLMIAIAPGNIYTGRETRMPRALNSRAASFIVGHAERTSPKRLTRARDISAACSRLRP